MALSEVSFHAPTVGSVISLVTALLLLLLSGFISASETAFFSLSPEELKRIKEGEQPSCRKADALLSDSERLLATVLTANNLVNVALILLLDLAFAQMITFSAQWLEFIVITVILTFILLLFGEIVPKLYSAHNSLSFSLKAAPLLTVLTTLLRPASSLLMRSKSLAAHIPVSGNYDISVDQLEHALELTDTSDIEEEKKWSKLGVLGADFESAGLFVVGRIRGIRCASILNNVVLYGQDSADAVSDYVGGESLTAIGEKREIETALEAFLRLEGK